MTDDRNLAGSREQTTTRHEELEKRMLLFAADVVRMIEKHRSLPKSVTDQLTRSATSIGANYAEACNAISKLDFRNKIYISKKEAAETGYWIDLCIELTNRYDWIELRIRSQELLLILQSIINTLKEKSAK